MAWNNQQSAPFWDFIRSMDNSGAPRPGPGVDHPANEGFFTFGGAPNQGAGPFGANFGGPFAYHGPHGPHHGPYGYGGGFERRGGRGGCGARGRNCRRNNNGNEDTERSGDEEQHARDANFNSENEKSGDPETSVPNEGDNFDHPHPHGHGPHGPHGPWEGRRGGRRHRHRGPPPPGFGGPDGGFDLNGLLGAFANHPIAQAFRGFAEQAAGQNASAPADVDSENTFTPPIDVFSTPSAYILHIALPGAKKEDVGVNWDADKSELNVAGVVYRAGDEEFLKTLSKSERKVGVFERSIKLPPGAEEKEEVDGDAISAKLEDGVLVVTVPKVEKDWTEVKKVDIE